MVQAGRWRKLCRNAALCVFVRISLVGFLVCQVCSQSESQKRKPSGHLVSSAPWNSMLIYTRRLFPTSSTRNKYMLVRMNRVWHSLWETSEQRDCVGCASWISEWVVSNSGLGVAWAQNLCTQAINFLPLELERGRSAARLLRCDLRLPDNDRV